MRLINVTTLKLEEFHHKIPPYAILSHTWGSDEVTFEMYQEYLDVTIRCPCPGTNVRNSNIEITAGFAKIMGACRRAHDDGLGYLWCDTNCIDKSSSAELSEAINSMYAWYRDSVVCYVYLADVDVFDKLSVVTEEFRKSRWFTRGWTLQELLAPKEVLFFNKGWEPIAARRHLAEIIRGITRIHMGALLDRNTINRYSVAQRMSWAADRETSRQEDIAYCLLGIFEINMPLLYGEGLKAFTRLQEEIIKVSDDESIFAWDFISDTQGECSGMLASSPREFASCDSIVKDRSVACSPYSMTNLGVSLKLPMIRSVASGSVLVELNCYVELREYGSLGAPQPAKVRSWRLPVWIWLNVISGKIFERSRFPQSRTSLLDFYHEGVNCKETELFGATRINSGTGTRTLSALLTKRNMDASTGFHVIIGFGRIKPGTRILEEAFHLRHFGVTQLPPRGSPALSHEIISAGSYVVLLSIVWDQQQEQPMHWRRHGIFFGLDGTTIRQMSMNNWDILFRTQPNPRLGRDAEAGRIDYIHDRIRKQTGQSDFVVDKITGPFVYVDKDLGQDQHGRAKVVAHLAFQE